MEEKIIEITTKKSKNAFDELKKGAQEMRTLILLRKEKIDTSKMNAQGAQEKIPNSKRRKRSPEKPMSPIIQ